MRNNEGDSGVGMKFNKQLHHAAPRLLLAPKPIVIAQYPQSAANLSNISPENIDRSHRLQRSIRFPLHHVSTTILLLNSSFSILFSIILPYHGVFPPELLD
jgi:hypothetical protein